EIRGQEVTGAHVEVQLARVAGVADRTAQAQLVQPHLARRRDRAGIVDREHDLADGRQVRRAAPFLEHDRVGAVFAPQDERLPRWWWGRDELLLRLRAQR